MPTVNVDIRPEIINWALSQTQVEKLGDKLMNNITKWLDGTKKPTFNQIEDFSKKANIPLGYFFLQTPPVEQIDLLEYRTVDSIQLANPSRNLIDTIHEMENIQDWMKTYRQDLGFDKLPIVGCMKGSHEVDVIVNRIRRDLEFDDVWYEKSKDAREAFNHIRRQLEICGVVVMMSGIVGKNTHRALDVDEFRAFAMVDDWAPLIFINTADSNGARLFSILHEVVHIWLGRDDLFNDRQSRISGVSDIEVLCNAVAGELYNQVAKTAIENYKRMKENKQTDGGDYYNTMGSRLDGCFIRALCESINMGRTTYTEAYRLTNTNMWPIQRTSVTNMG